MLNQIRIDDALDVQRSCHVDHAHSCALGMEILLLKSWMQGQAGLYNGFILAKYSLYVNSENFAMAYCLKQKLEVNPLKYQRLRDLREDADLYQRQLAELLNCSQRIYSNYERGDVDIPTEVLIKLADIYDTTTDYLLGRTNCRENPFPDKSQRQ